MRWPTRRGVVLMMWLLAVLPAVPDHELLHSPGLLTGDLEKPGPTTQVHVAVAAALEHLALGAVGRPTTAVVPTRHAERWACASPEIRGVLIGYPKQRVGSCVSLTLYPLFGALVGGSLTEDQVEVLVWALELFEQADMQLPTFLVSHEPEDACNGAAAVVSSTALVPHIRMCTSHTGTTLEWVMLHELGHIWAELHVDQEGRALFLAVRSLAAWRSDVWAESGSEHAAEVIVWALMDRQVRPIHLRNMSCIELLVAYRALTGGRPLHGFTEVCSRD